MIIDWWPVIALPAVLVLSVLPSPAARARAIGHNGEPPAESDGERPPDCRAARLARRDRRHAYRPAQGDAWLIQLKAACEAGYYKAGCDDPPCRPPDDAVCRECFFWQNEFCRLWGSQRRPDAPVCSFFHTSPATTASEHHRNEASGSQTGERL